jgi:hypothetical protein
LERPNSSKEEQGEYVEGQFDFQGFHQMLMGESSSKITVDDSGLPLSSTKPVSDLFDTARSMKGNYFAAAPLEWTQFIQFDNTDYLGGGGFADVYGGQWTFPEGRVTRIDSLPQVVLKRFRISPSTPLSKNGRQTEDDKGRIKVRRHSDQTPIQLKQPVVARDCGMACPSSRKRRSFRRNHPPCESVSISSF